ncbi:hypothetical protein CH063_09163 [Colletotrichum higginsianum]|uniref:Uncharacterized protein n=1 Tax=Colletotrichum higginsianum (strain IMI 349063) TaxID=759273 RepID=H1VCJ1_COLHI|nr:hypothetical protein CH063_09163 [Colletotrichum higginsianum]
MNCSNPLGSSRRAKAGVPRHVRTTINYYRDPGDGTEHAPSIAGKRSTFNQPSIDLNTTITDITGSEHKYTLDSHGFQLCSHVSQEKTFDSEERIKQVYYTEVQQLVLKMSATIWTGASRLHIFDHTIRRPNPVASHSDEERRQ